MEKLDNQIYKVLQLYYWYGTYKKNTSPEKDKKNTKKTSTKLMFLWASPPNIPKLGKNSQLYIEHILKASKSI